MTDNTEYNIVEFNDISGKPEDINSIDEKIPERIPEPWESAPEGLVYYKELYEDGHLGTFTSDPEIAYIRGYFENSIPESDLEVSDVDGRTYLKNKCPHKTQEMIDRENAIQEISQLKKQLSDTDYKAIKYAEGQLTEEEYSPTRTQRAAWRARINKLQEDFNI